ncbi:MAG TPA: hypothetical protein VH682_03900 [Gemmataceae bacterium]
MNTPGLQLPRPNHRLARLLVGSLLALVLPVGGCGNQEYAEVEGMITLDGQPLPKVKVAFLPDPERGSLGPCAVAYTDEHGHYRLTSEKGQVGVIVGQHRVCIHDLTVRPELPGTAGAKGNLNLKPPGQSLAVPQASNKATLLRFSKDYADATQTPLRPVEVKLGHQTLNFDLLSASHPQAPKGR